LAAHEPELHVTISPSPSLIERQPLAAFAIFLCIHVAVWTALPTLLYANLPLDLIEALTYGREWQLGYDKLPPLPWWLVEIVRLIVGHDFGYYLLAELSVVAAFALVFATALPLVGATGALAAVLIADGLHYFNYTAAKFNHDVIQLPFWALAGFALHRALRGGAWLHWVLLGLAVGISLWAKYFVIVLAAPIALLLLADRDARRTLATPGPWIAAVVALLVMAPHLVWLVENDFLPFAYASARAAPSRGVIDHLLHPASFAASQLGFLLPSLLIAAPLFLPRGEKGTAAFAADAFDRRIVAWLAFGPLLAILALSALSGRGTVAMWGYPLFLFLGLWIVLHAGKAVAGLRLKRLATLWAAVSAVLAIAFVVNYEVLPRYDHRYRAVLYPGDALAHEISRRYRAVTGQPLVYVIATMWDGGNIAHYSSARPRVLIDGKPERAPWIDLGDLRSKGAVVVWTDGDLNTVPVAYRAIAADAQVQEPFRLPYRRGDNVLNVGWAILMARPHFAAR
jgi:4-amino-4-deoxy-L-arabinose transferase-like glycosyltransferase